jgi:hypothetical protein
MKWSFCFLFTENQEDPNWFFKICSTVVTNNRDFEKNRKISTRKVLAFFQNLLREYKIFASAKLNKDSFTTCHQIATRMKATLTLAVPVMPSWCWKSPSVFLAYTNAIVLGHTNQSTKFYFKNPSHEAIGQSTTVSSTSLKQAIESNK